MNRMFSAFLFALLVSFRAFAGPIVVMPSTTEGYVAGSSSGSASILPVKTLGAACVATPTENTGITADYSAVLTCNGGVWARHEAAWWRAPVASYAALPVTSNSIGDARITTNTGRAFTWNGSSWVALAIDQNGNLSVPGNLSVTGTSTFSGAATFGGVVTIGDGTAATAANTLVINRTATESTACSPNGAIARDATGGILSCQAGVWKKLSGANGINTCSASYLAGTYVGDWCKTDEGRMAVYGGTYSGKYLITTVADSSGGYAWGCYGTATGAISTIDGASNSTLINSASCPSYPDKAAALCTSIGTGWYMPARSDLDVLWVNRALIGGFISSVYWSSTESNSTYVWYIDFRSGVWNLNYKTNTGGIRCIRAY